MFGSTSRYYSLETATHKTLADKEVTYVKRRFLPEGKNMLLLVEVSVTQGDRLDNITASTLGDPEQFWRVCDANNAMNPTDLTTEPGETLRVPIPQA
jgi:hypothetical protein